MIPFTLRDPAFLSMTKSTSFDPNKFVIKVNSGADSQFTIPTNDGGYNYDLTTSDGQSFTGLTGDQLIIFPSANIDYILEVSGDFPWWYQNNNSEAVKVKDIIQWGDIEWSSFRLSFFGCSNLIISATDAPDLSLVTTMFNAFRKSSVNQDISGWDVSSVTNMHNMFLDSSFNQDISGWDVSNVTVMIGMFKNTPFNQDISNWNVSSVTRMDYMFMGSPFNQDISGWNTSNVTNMGWMFNTTPFNQDISTWIVSNVTNMSEMFRQSQFNQDIGSWNVSSVLYMGGMFWNSQFNQDISGWNVTNVVSWGNFRTGSPLTNANTPPKFL